MTATIPVVFPANRLVANDFHSQPFIVLTNSVGGIVGTCGSTDNEINQDRGTITVAGSVNCASPPAPSKVTINNCAPVPGFPFNPGNCHKFESIVIDFGAAAGCTQPQPGGCSNDGGGVGGACCVGPFGSAPVVGGGIAEGSFPVDYTRSPSASTAFGEAPRSPIALTLPESAPPGFELRYLYGGPSSPGAPENPNWIRHLGQHWTNEYSQRIVPSPDETSVWLITSSGAFRNFSTPDVEGTYQDRFPLSEKRALHWLGAGQGWQLDGLDGSATFFRADGLWERSADAHGVEAVGTYGSNPPRLTKVDLPDGRHVEINYFANGKVSSMIEVGVSGSSTRTWSYVWTAVDTSSRIDQNLRRVVRPDGARWRLTYDGELIPHLIRAYLEGTGGTPSRVAGAWEFDASGNLAATWRGAESFAASTDPSKYSWIYSDESTVQLTDGYGSTTTFTYEREPLSGMPRVLAVAGACPGCVGLAPNSAMAYEDLENPLKPTEITNGRGFVTRLAYDEQGMLVSRREAELEAGFDRTTAWQYSGPFDALATRIEGPAGQGEVASRIVDLLYEADGDLESRTTSGEETDGIQVPGTFQYTTNFTHTAQGVRESSDPPGYGIDDVTSWTITDVSRGLLLPAKRTDPLVGDTLFSWDDFNRKSTETDANGLVTERQYDSMSRIAEVKLHGDLGTTADDLVTRYFYTPLGEIGCVKYPRGNGVQYLYESTTGRLAETIRGTAVTNPTSSTCLDSAQPRERRLLTYTLAGGTPPFVVNEQLQRFVGGVWVTDAENERVYETSCQLSKSIAGANHPEASTTSFGYDCNGNTTSVTQALGTALETTTTYAFDPLDRLQSVTQAWGGTGGGVQMTAYEYDAQDHLIRVTDAEGNETTYLYSDRDLLTRQESPVTGITRYRYNEHGELTEEHQDARAISILRTVDAADRLTEVDYPGSGLDTTYAWDQESGPLEEPLLRVGHLFSISNSSASVEFDYDANWRLIGEGLLSFTLDANGNRTEVVYPQGITVRTTYDFADRPAKLEWKEGAGSFGFLVGDGTTSASYAALGPMVSLPLGNTRTETRSFDARFAPATISVSGSLLAWNYTVDALGEVTAIDDALASSEDRAFGYQPHQRYLISAAGPWEGPLDWTYDRIGNRLSEIRGGVGGYADTYEYVSNGAGNTPTLDRIDRGGNPLRDYAFDGGGFLDAVVVSGATVELTFDAAGRLAQTSRPAAGETLDYNYDGRGFLAQAKTPSTDLEPPCPVSTGAIFCDGYESTGFGCWSEVVGGTPGGACPWRGVFDAIEPAYSSTGSLYGLDRMFSGTLDRRAVIYFGDRPLALWQKVDSAASTMTYLTTDHLGTPILAMSSVGAERWSGGFEPFGRDWQEGLVDDALGKGIFLRLPGQWDDMLFESSTVDVDLYYNVHRWYETQTGRYTRPDPFGIRGDSHLYAYARLNPLSFVDPLGLKSRVCCRPIKGALGYTGNTHCYIEIETETGNATCGLYRVDGAGEVKPDHPDDAGGDCGEWNPTCSADACAVRVANNYPNPSEYSEVGMLVGLGGNSNTFASEIARSCGLKPPALVGEGSAPGWGNPPPYQEPGRAPIPAQCAVP